jgi:uncharacterized protein (TIGR03790 family)
MTAKVRLCVKRLNKTVITRTILLVVSLWLITPISGWAQSPIIKPIPKILFPASGLGPEDIAVIINSADPNSVEIGAYYQKKRGIPAENIITVSFSAKKKVMLVETFLQIKARVDALTPPHIQAYALTWAQPYRVGCMSITTAFALGFDHAYCAKGCKPTKPQPYLYSDSDRPFQDFNMRPTMSLAGKSIKEVKALIDRGVASDGTAPTGTAYLVETKDRARSVRSMDYAVTISSLSKRVDIQHVQAQSIRNRPDVLFYFTGLKHVPDLKTNQFLPGAIGDHLTSAGGLLTGKGSQMSSLRWLEAGATGSYGAVIEPCNFPHKFPHPALVIDRYTRGDSLIEAYWKSVVMPGQGIFIGEPLANPFRGHQVEYSDGQIIVRTRSARRGYIVQCAEAPVAPVKSLLVPAHHRMKNDMLEIRFSNPGLPYCKLIPKPPKGSQQRLKN